MIPTKETTRCDRMAAAVAKKSTSHVGCSLRRDDDEIPGDYFWWKLVVAIGQDTVATLCGKMKRQ
jgi:hypothetical protein